MRLCVSAIEKQIMEENENREERPGDGKSGSPEEIHDNQTVNIESETSNKELQIERTEIPMNSGTINYKPETENMEVHHHPQLEHKPKPWKEYFLEYLMIVLAVTTGFFAESLREHLSDKSKEHEYISSFKNDLVKDTANIHTWILAFNSRINEYDSLISMLRDPGKVTDKAEMYYMARMTTRGTVFDDNNNALVQLNISGNFRLISNKTTAGKIIAYENDIDNYKNINGYDAYEARALYQPQSKIFDAFVFNDMSQPITDSNVNGNNALVSGFRKVFVKPSGNPKLLTEDKNKINEFVYYLHQRRSTFAAEILVLYKQKQDATELINIINKEYNLENE